MEKRQKHGAEEMIRNIKMSLYVGKGWKSEFTCPTCGRKVWQHLNFLGQRKMICNGDKITKEANNIYAKS